MGMPGPGPSDPCTRETTPCAEPMDRAILLTWEAASRCDAAAQIPVVFWSTC